MQINLWAKFKIAINPVKIDRSTGRRPLSPSGSGELKSIQNHLSVSLSEAN